MATVVHPPEISLPLQGIERVSCDHGQTAEAIERAVSRAQRTEAPLLVARQDGAAAWPAAQFLVAVDDEPDALGLVRFASILAAESDGYVHLAHVRGRAYGSGTRHRLAELSLEVIAITGAEPIVDVLHGAQVAVSLIGLAQRCESSLLVVGRSRAGAARSLGSVGEALVRRAPCSVLVVPAARTP